MRVIYKYNSWALRGLDYILEAPEGKILLVGAQYPGSLQPTLWIEHEVSDISLVTTLPWYNYVMKGTGGGEIGPSLEHVGSCICQQGDLVWHVYREPK